MKESTRSRAETLCLSCGGHCCDGAHPPISNDRYWQLVSAGISKSCFEYEGYLRLRTHKDDTCILMKNNKCTCHTIKPETCRAGPFTFDVTEKSIRIFLKHPSICPLVTLLREDTEMYHDQFDHATDHIGTLVAGLSNEEITAINAIDEPDTDLVAEIPMERNRL